MKRSLGQCFVFFAQWVVGRVNLTKYGRPITAISIAHQSMQFKKCLVPTIFGQRLMRVQAPLAAWHTTQTQKRAAVCSPYLVLVVLCLKKSEQISQSRSLEWKRPPWRADWPSRVVNMLLTLRKFVQASLNYDKANASSTLN